MKLTLVPTISRNQPSAEAIHILWAQRHSRGGFKHMHNTFQEHMHDTFQDSFVFHS